MSRVLRYDQGQLAPPKRRDNGWLEAEGKLARVGIQEYEQSDGTITRELRLPEEVFRKETLDSFHLVPVTATHPPVLLDANNAATFSKGSVGQVRQDGDWIVGPLLVTDSATIQRVESGELPELSTGYSCELTPPDPTLVPKWGPHDSIQRNILANHQALVQSARAGPDARLRLDSTGNAISQRVASLGTGARMPQSIRIDGRTFELNDANVPNIEREIADAIKRASEAEKNRADAATTELTKAKGAFKIVKDNGTKACRQLKKLRQAFDAKKAVKVPCDECNGTGKVPDDADASKTQDCKFCDGDGEYQLHMPISKATGSEEGEADEQDPDAMAGDPDQDMDENELEVEQETEGEAPKAAKGDKARKDARNKRRAEYAAFEQKRADSLRRQVDRAMKGRVALVDTARKVLGDTDVGKLDAAGIHKLVIAKLSPKTKLDGLKPADLASKFDTLIEALGDSADASANASDLVRGATSPFLVQPLNRVDGNTEEKEDGSHLSGKARMEWRLQQDAKKLLNPTAQ